MRLDVSLRVRYPRRGLLRAREPLRGVMCARLMLRGVVRARIPLRGVVRAGHPPAECWARVFCGAPGALTVSPGAPVVR